MIRWTHHHEYIMRKPFCSAYSPSPTLLSSCNQGNTRRKRREKKNEGMREEQWESERQQTTHGLYFIPTDLNKHKEINNVIYKTYILIRNNFLHGKELFSIILSTIYLITLLYKLYFQKYNKVYIQSKMLLKLLISRQEVLFYI